jgi:hypothetical protein
MSTVFPTFLGRVPESEHGYRATRGEGVRLGGALTKLQNRAEGGAPHAPGRLTRIPAG